MPSHNPHSLKTSLEIELNQEDIDLLDAIGKSQGFSNRSEVVEVALKSAAKIWELSDRLKGK